MATAGRILIMPKGTWNAKTTYENLDMVAHSGRAWLAKKASVGIEPSDASAEFWHDFLGMDVFTEGNPPTAAQVGAVSLYADPVLSKSTDWDNLECGTYRFSTWSGSGGKGYPPVDDVGICILFETASGRYMYCLGMDRIVCRYYESKTWSDWIEGYLPKIGGTVKNLIVERNGDQSYIQYIGNKASVGYLGFNGANNPVFIKDDATTICRLFGEHNKPYSTYKGNGNTAVRTINTGGIGYVCAVWGNGTNYLVMPHGTLRFFENTVEAVSREEMKFNNGVLTIASVHANVSDVTYYYQVL